MIVLYYSEVVDLHWGTRMGLELMINRIKWVWQDKLNFLWARCNWTKEVFRSDFAQKLHPISLMEKGFVQLKLFLDETRQQTR